jgi:hypothetical protein
MARAPDPNTVVRFPRDPARPYPHNLVRILEDDADALCFQVRVGKEDLRSILSCVVEEDRETMLLSVNAPKSVLRSYAPLFAVLLSSAEGR